MKTTVRRALFTLIGILAGSLALMGVGLLCFPAQVGAQASTPLTLPGCWTKISDIPGSQVSFRQVNLHSVSALASNDVWAVGAYTPQNSPAQTFTMHWDGQQWSVVSSPSPGSFTNNLVAVAAIAHDDVWAVGSYGTSKSDSKTLAMHWDGHRWDVIASPSPGPQNSWLSGVSGSSGKDVWAVGTYLTGAPNDQRIFTLHWDGSAWTKVPVGSLATNTPTATPTNAAATATPEQAQSDPYGNLNGVVALAPDNAWAAGLSLTQPSGLMRSLLIHWDGNRWDRVPPGGLVGTTHFDAISASGPNDIWAVGFGAPNGGMLLAVHFDGSQWTTQPVPMSGAIGQLLSVAAIAPGDAWAAGRYEPTHGRDLPLLERWDGRDWNEVTSPLKGGDTLAGIAGVPATPGAQGSELYAVGSSELSSPIDPQAFVLHYTDAPCPATPTPQPQPTPLAPPVPLPGQGSITFPETGKTVSGRFLEYWRANGGLAQQGFPISEVIGEISDLNGRPYTVQYFERAVFEYHPELEGSPYSVLLSQLGTFEYRRKYPGGAPGQQPDNTAGSVLFKETGHRLGGRFLEYWRANGGLLQQGYPLSDEFTEVSPLDGKSYTVQYFERAVFELHPENQRPHDVLLSQLGKFRWDEKYVQPRPAVAPTRTATVIATP